MCGHALATCSRPTPCKRAPNERRGRKQAAVEYLRRTPTSASIRNPGVAPAVVRTRGGGYVSLGQHQFRDVSGLSGLGVRRNDAWINAFRAAICGRRNLLGVWWGAHQGGEWRRYSQVRAVARGTPAVA